LTHSFLDVGCPLDVDMNMDPLSSPSEPAHPLSGTKHPVSILMELAQTHLISVPDFTIVTDPSSTLQPRFRAECRLSYKGLGYDLEATADDSTKKAAKTKDLQTLCTQAAQGSGLLTILKLLPQQHSVADTSETSSKLVIGSHPEDHCDSTTAKEDSCPETEKLGQIQFCW